MEMNLGDRIASLRKARGWTQVKLAEAAGLSASAIAMYETNRRHPDGQALHKLAQAFGTSVGALTQPEPKNEVAVMSHLNSARPLSPSSHPADRGLTTLTLSRDEARFILFLRMNPRAKSFLESYMFADDAKREQLEKTWRLIHDFQV
jgi:transcriptional regulator with XRE-family HTH domain